MSVIHPVRKSIIGRHILADAAPQLSRHPTGRHLRVPALGLGHLPCSGTETVPWVSLPGFFMPLLPWLTGSLGFFLLRNLGCLYPCNGHTTLASMTSEFQCDTVAMSLRSQFEFQRERA